jgi:hypothetical protein
VDLVRWHETAPPVALPKEDNEVGVFQVPTRKFATRILLFDNGHLLPVNESVTQVVRYPSRRRCDWASRTLNQDTAVKQLVAFALSCRVAAYPHTQTRRQRGPYGVNTRTVR